MPKVRRRASSKTAKPGAYVQNGDHVPAGGDAHRAPHHGASPPWARWLDAVLKGVAWTAVLASIVSFLLVALKRLGYPFELEWMEGAMLVAVERVLSQQPIYGPPSLEFVPLPYNPLFYYIAASVARIFGLGLPSLRLLSLTATLISFVLIYAIVHLETRDRFSSSIAVALYAACFRAGGAWFDLARVDSLCLAFVLLSLYIIRVRPSRGGLALAGVVSTLAFLVKQTAILAYVPLAAFLLGTARRESLYFIMTLAALVAASVLILDHLSGGWYSFYALEIPVHHTAVPTMLVGFWTRYVLSTTGIACAVVLFAIMSRSWSTSGRIAWFYGAAVAGLIGGSWLVKLNRGTYDNVVLPAYAAIAIVFGIAVHSVSRCVGLLEGRAKVRLDGCVFLLCGLQLLALAYDPREQLPTDEDLAAGWRLAAFIGEIEGEVFMPSHSMPLLLAGKRPGAHEVALNDVWMTTPSLTSTELGEELSQGIQDKRFAAVVTRSADSFRAQGLQAHYQVRERLFEDGDEDFWPVTGIRCRPEWVYVPIGGEEAPAVGETADNQ